MSRIPELWEDVFTSDGEPNLIDRDLLVDMLRSADNQSRARADDPLVLLALWEFKYYRKLVRVVFDIVSYLNMNDPYVRYNACDLFERFIQEHIDHGNTSQDPINYYYRTEAVGGRLKRLSLLRIINCIMLSSKISSRDQVRHFKDYNELLKKLGKRIAKRNMIAQEVQMLCLVKGKIEQCPVYPICSLLILTLVYNDPTIDGKLLHSKLYDVMDCFYLNKADIMNDLFARFRKLRKFDIEEFKRYISNSMLVGCGIVAVVPSLVGVPEKKVYNELANITCYPKKEILVLRDAILAGILNDSSESSDYDH